MPTIELETATLDYADSGGTGPVVVLLHGPLLDHTVWDAVIDRLPGMRCLAPTLPMGAHRHPAPHDELTNASLARLVAEFLAALDLTDVTLVLNDWGGAQVIVELGLAERVGRLALVACEAFDNVPAGRPGRMLARMARLPGGLALQAQLTRIPAVRRQLATGMAAQPVPDELLRRWFTPSRDPRIRDDLRRFSARFPIPADRDWSSGLGGFAGPALVAWAEDDRMMPAEHGPRLAQLLPDAELVHISGAATLVPLDQPGVLAHHLRTLVARPVPDRRARA
ncbi:alpha/beta hydrolase fold protein [Beutenbergia cavernae DSM 12333]|uniref:Alpha/beta hydrolase fold protein n=1 Tax=Beutenbergia cavernae (strain ATCC BAA-8 / DSM 12333 / CCUG 43141 / JCM 11478 / NBRC 16432 / NCIMB 13614 / HKI 0122) TaxID=471853 RepID=C5C478_BEUC1|nr:alpha/beta hydrolase [Beutenbergia cavernae]ACQ79991.1 alpha/beta hydrolase fold protein [Beutenbergia cavernae DSM 12333]